MVKHIICDVLLIYRQLTRRNLQVHVSEFSFLCKLTKKTYPVFLLEIAIPMLLFIRTARDLVPRYCMRLAPGPPGMEPEVIIIVVTLVSY